MILLALVLAVAVAVAVYVGSVYRGLAALRKGIELAWADIDALLKERHDELPKLLDACARHMPLEQDSLEKVMRARTSIGAASASGNVAAVGAAERQLRSAMARLYALAQRHAPLQGDATFRRLQSRIADLDVAIADRREPYNERVNLNNIRVHVLPDAMVAGWFGFGAAHLLEFGADERREAG